MALTRQHIKGLRSWAPRFWAGMTFPAWWRLIFHNHFNFSFTKLYIAIIDTLVSLTINSPLTLVKKLTYRRKLAGMEFPRPPLFIIGHWRTGTTLLHELLAGDPSFTYSTYYQCFAPSHFLLTKNLFPKLFNFLMPSHRPMDNMGAGWDKAQEDEFALCNLGIPSPYWTIAFPNRPPQFPEYFSLDGLKEKDLGKWKMAWIGFLKEIVSLNPGKRLVLKSPTHSFRIKLILDLFPRAQFIHIIRDPYVVFPSTLHLWKTLYRTQGFQNPNFLGLEDSVLSTYVELNRKVEEGRRLVDPVNFYELKYEDLIADPLGRLKALYEGLNLGNFEKLKPTIEAYFKTHSGYQTNRYDLSQEMRREITQRWGPIIEKLGYPLQ